MRKLTIGLLLVAACGGPTVAATPSTQPPTTVAPTTTAPTTVAPTTTAPTTTTVDTTPTTTVDTTLPSALAEALMVETVRDWSADKPLNVTDWLSDSEILELAYLTCEALDHGASILDLAVLQVENFDDELDLEGIAYITGAGIGAFCPEYADQVDAFLGDEG